MRSHTHVLPLLVAACFATAFGPRTEGNVDGLRRFPPTSAESLAATSQKEAALRMRGAMELEPSLNALYGKLGGAPITWPAQREAPKPIWSGPRWVPLPAPSMQFHSLVYDGRRHRLIAFGGAPYAFYDDYPFYPPVNRVWALSLNGHPEWKELQTAGEEAPAPRLGHAAIYDPIRDRMVIFGGSNNISGAPPYLNDVWELSLTGTPHWTRLETEGPQPAPRTGHCVIYDPVHDAMLVFGSTGGGYEAPLNDTWSLALEGIPTWTKMEFSSPVPPALAASSNAYAAVYDPLRHRMIVVGRGVAPVLEAWALALDGVMSWTRIATSGTPAPTRVDHSCVLDVDGDRLIVFAGYAPGIHLNDAWTLTLGKTPTWIKLFPAGMPPAARASHTAVYDPIRHRLIVVGGPSTEQGMDTWELSLKGRHEWSAVIDGGPPSPGRVDHTAVYDSRGDRMVVFGGWTYAYGKVMGDTWTLSFNKRCVWSPLSNEIQPGPAPWRRPGGRVGHSAIYDPVRERMLVFGGLDATGQLVNDTWSLSLKDPLAWSRLETPDGAPVPRFAHRAIYDTESDRMIVFGGRGLDAMQDDVWALSLAEPPRWTEITPAQPGPAARGAFGMIYDPVGKRMIVCGGTDDQRLYDDTWALALAAQPAWSQIHALASPSARRRYHSAIYDLKSERLVIWGGNRGGVDLEEASALSLRGQSVWTPMTSGNEAPQARNGHSAVYDPRGGLMVVFGGDYDLNDTWALPLERSRGRARVTEEIAALGGATMELSSPRPNPSAGEMQVEFMLPHAGHVSLAVFDAAGRRVRSLAEGAFAPGKHSLRWDSRDAEGHLAPIGLYFMRLEAGGRASTQKTVVAR